MQFGRYCMFIHVRNDCYLPHDPWEGELKLHTGVRSCHLLTGVYFKREATVKARISFTHTKQISCNSFMFVHSIEMTSLRDTCGLLLSMLKGVHAWPV